MDKRGSEGMKEREEGRKEENKKIGRKYRERKFRNGKRQWIVLKNVNTEK